MAGKKWAKVTPEGPPPPTGNKVIGYFDPERGVLVLEMSGEAWVDRLPKAASAERE